MVDQVEPPIITPLYIMHKVGPLQVLELNSSDAVEDINSMIDERKLESQKLSKNDLERLRDVSIKSNRSIEIKGWTTVAYRGDNGVFHEFPEEPYSESVFGSPEIDTSASSHKQTS